MAYVVTHPIQYQAPLLRRLSQEEGISLDVLFCSDFSVRGFEDPGFNVKVEWDVPLLEGYSYEFLPALGPRDRVSFWRPLNHGLLSRLRSGRYDVVWLHGYTRLFFLYAIALARLLRIPVLVRDEATAISAVRGPAKRAVKRGSMAVLKRTVFGFLPIGTLNREYYESYGVSAERMWMVPYAVDNEYFQSMCRQALAQRASLRQELGLAPGRPVILYASKLSERKRPHDLLDAYEMLSHDGVSEPQPYLLFVGDGEMRGRLEHRVRQLGWASVKFAGFQNQSKLPAFYSLCDVFVLPSMREPWGLVVNEAMNAGRAVVVSDEVGSHKDLVRDGQNGWVFPAGNARALYQRLGECLDDQARLREFGEASLDIINGWGIEAATLGLLSAIRAAAATR